MRIPPTKIVITIILLIFWNLEGFTQNIVWSEDFGNGIIPSTWTNTDASGQITTPWEHSRSGYYFGNQPTFSSPTASNGFVIFNSDAAGLQDSAHDVRLTTDAIDCSNLATVLVTFSNQYAYYSPDSISYTELGVSTDGINFNYYPILTQVLQNDLTTSETVEQIDITADAAGEYTVYLQFRWKGNWEYAWRIDDITVHDMFFTTDVSRQDLTINQSLTIFPNPVSESLTTNIDLKQMTKTVRITIYNTHGQIIESRKLNNIRREQVLFNLEKYSSGAYLISIDTDFGQTINRFIVKK